MLKWRRFEIDMIDYSILTIVNAFFLQTYKKLFLKSPSMMKKKPIDQYAL